MEEFRIALSILIFSQCFFHLVQADGADGNPHGWDRIRRCDQQDYEIPCGVCEGVGGIPWGDKNEEISLTSCSTLGTAADLPEPKPIVWGTHWTLPLAYEILIGKKTDPFCFQTFPSNDSVGEHCYRKQTGSKVYDMVDALAFRQELDVESPVGNISSIVLHQGRFFWVVNHLPWYAGGVHQCVCTEIREGSGGDRTYYPVQYNWVEKMVYIGRERLGIEYINTVEEVDHWAFGPHHLWTYPDTGNIIRMWQPFNGLQIYPTGVPDSEIDHSLFSDIPPTLCKSPIQGGVLFRNGCDSHGYPEPDKKTTARPRDVVRGKDLKRAETKVPRGHYKGMDFCEMSEVLNGWLNSSMTTVPCSDWEVEDLQRLQALLYLARESQFDDIYHKTRDNRRLRPHVFKDIKESWSGLNKLAHGHPDPRMKAVRRDGHCHEAVMWYVHHLEEDVKQLLRSANIPLPLLSNARHGQCYGDLDHDGQEICDSYMEQVSCASCHSNETPPHH